MARHPFGGDLSGWVFTVAAGGGVQIAGGATVTLWSSRTGGTQYTDLTSDMAGSAPLAAIVTDTGSGGFDVGTIPLFYGPDGVTSMWVDAGSHRVLMITNDIDTLANVGVTHSALTGNPHGVGLAGLADVALTSLLDQQIPRYDAASGKWKNVTLAPGLAIGSPATRYVVASGAASIERSRGDYLCDGTADNVEIQAAIAAVRAAGGGTVLLSPGQFNLAATINLLGTDDTSDETEIYLTGAGPGNTRLLAAAGITGSMLHLGQCVRAHVRDIDIVVAGALDGISSTRSTAPAGGDRAFWMSSLKNITIAGPGDGTHTGWAMQLGSPFRSVFENIEIGGGGNGIRLYSETDNFNPGDLVWTRIFVDTVGTNKIALQLDSATGTGNLNHILFHLFEAFSESNTGTGIYITGNNQPSRMQFHGVNLEQFATDINLDNCVGIEINGNYIVPYLAGTVIRFGTFACSNTFRCNQLGAWGANTTVVNDTNTTVDQPNILERVHLATFASGDSFISAGTATAQTVMRDITHDGPGSPGTLIRNPRARLPSTAIVTLTDGATINTDVSQGNHFRVTLAGNRTLANPTKPVDGQTVTWEIIQDATGSRTITLGSQFAIGSFAITLSTTASKRDFLTAVWNATSSKWYITAFTKNY